jgi:hypothetical protein
MEQLSCGVEEHPVLNVLIVMKRNELTPKQLSSVACPTCGSSIGRRCVLNSGSLRSQPHLERKFAAIDASQKKSG